MSSNLDPAIKRALQLSPSAQTSVSAHGSSGFSSTLRITITNTKNNKDENATSASSSSFFAKTAPGKAAATMFAGEYASLNAIHAAVPSLCPAALGHGELAEQKGVFFLVTQWLDLSASASASISKDKSAGSGLSLAAKLAKLHSTPAPVPDGYEKPMFGFPVTTCCGDTPQDNSYKASWAEFYAENRLRAIVRRSEMQNGKDAELRDLVERTAARVVPRLLRDGHLGGGGQDGSGSGVVPVVVHGDMWSGNRGRGRIGGADAVEDLVFDPSASYSHSEFEFGIMRMFGGFGGDFAREYHRLLPKTEPVEEFDDRVRLYELYHHLNHHSIFGGGYRSGAVSIMKSLIKKYGDEGG